MKKRRKLIVGIIIAAVAVGGFFIWNSRAQTPVNPNENAPTVALEKADMVKTVSASGAVKSANTTNIYSTQTGYPVMEILADLGDTVKKGDILARLDMSRLENEIAQAELNLMSAQTSASEENRLNTNAVTTAETSLNSSRIALERQTKLTANAEKDLREAEADLEKEFDGYAYDKLIEDARIAAERRETELQTAREELAKAEAEEFDGYTYQNAVRDAETSLARRENDLAEARSNLEEELNKSDKFDPYTYQNVINEAQKLYDRSKTATNEARDAALKAEDDYYNKINNGELVTTAQIDAEWLKVEAAQKNIDTVKQREDDALASLNKAKTDLERARKDFNENNEEAREKTIESLEKAVESAEDLLSDAKRLYDDAVENLRRAEENYEENLSDLVKTSRDAVTRAENNLFDARRAYDKAVSDKERAIEDYVEANEDRLETLRRNYNDSLEQLESAQNSYNSAQNALTQAKEKPSSSGTNVEIQQINLNKLYTTLEEGEIIATAGGVVTEMNAKVGAPPSGILFVVEDAADLYVSANIKEYSLSSVSVGQNAFVTTDATGDAVFDARVDYISPKAVSPAGSTSVEFEIRAGFNGDENIRIGMNAFVNVVTETKQAVYSVPLSAIVTDERGSFVYSPDGAERIEIPVTVGIKTTTQGEIAGEGLYDGLVILTQPTELPESGFPGGMMFGR